MSAAPTKTPVLPVITIKKNDSSLYNYNPFTSTFDFKIQKLQVNPPADSQGGKFNLQIIPPAGADVTTMNTILSNIQNGNEVTIWLGKSNSSLTKVFLGVIENISIDESGPNYMQVTIDGPDWGSDILKNRISLYYKVQRYQADNITLDQTDPNVTILQIVTDLLTSTLAYPFNDITVAAQGVVLTNSNIDTSIQNVRIPQIMSNLEHLDDKLSELDNWCNAVHYVDANKNFIMKPAVPQPNPVGSGLPSTWLFTDSIADSLIASWTTGNVGYISMNGSSYKYTTENYKHRIIGIGSEQVSIDGSALGTPVQQTTNAGSDNMTSSTWFAQKFNPIFAKGYSIAIFIASVGVPTVDLIVNIVQDNNGKPTGQVIRNLYVPRSQVNSTPGWSQINIGVDYLVPSAYWIVIPSNPAFSGINTFAWYKGGSGFVTSTSSDGITWTNATGQGYMFISYTSVPLKIAMPGNGLNASDKVFHEETYRQAFITNAQALVQYLNSITKVTNNKKEIYMCKIYSPDNIPLPFASILLRKILSGLQFNTSNSAASWVYHILGTIRFNFQATDEETTGMFWMDCQLVRFTSFP